MSDPKLVRFTYKNHRGEVGLRQVIPEELIFDSTQWHPEKQWLLVGYDVEKGANRSFAMKDILFWETFDHPKE